MTFFKTARNYLFFTPLQMWNSKAILRPLKTRNLQKRQSRKCLTKPKVLNPLSVSTKGKNSLVLDLRYLKNLFFIDKIRFNDWNIFQNYLQDNKGYLFKFDLKNGYGHVSIFDEHQTHLASAGKLISKRIILSLLSYLLD